MARTDSPESFWNRSRTLALACQSCAACYGLGMRPSRNDSMLPCNCVFRAVFRAVYSRFRRCAEKAAYIGRVSLEANPGAQNRSKTWGMKNEEFAADFCLVARRALDDTQYQLFRLHFLLGADWKLCCPKLGLDRGQFFHEVYRIEQKLGRTFAELLPYPLFPTDQYFASTPGRKRSPDAAHPGTDTHTARQNGRPVHAPVRALAAAA